MIGDKVFIIELSGCEWGGAASVAFDSQKKAQAWCDADRSKDSPPYAVEHYDIKEVVIQ